MSAKTFFTASLRTIVDDRSNQPKLVLALTKEKELTRKGKTESERIRTGGFAVSLQPDATRSPEEIFTQVQAARNACAEFVMLADRILQPQATQPNAAQPAK